MRIGVPKEIKVQEHRVGLTPESVRVLTERGHEVIVEHDAGVGMGAANADYRTAGASIAASAAAVFGAVDLIVKVKEPLAVERARFRPGQALFTYLHLAADAAQAKDLMDSGVTAIAYESVTSADGRLPLLAPMSEVAGRMAAQVAAHFLEKPHGGRGVLMSGATGAPAAKILVLGAGVVGSNAAAVAMAMGAAVTVLDRSPAALERVCAQLGAKARTVVSVDGAIEAELREADAVIGAALVPGALAPKLVTRAMLGNMLPGAVLIDVAIDQGGCFETSRPTTHDDPTYVVDGILHYCVANMPGAVPRTSTYALNRVTLDYVGQIADHGVIGALRKNEHLRNGLTVYAGRIIRPEVAHALGLNWTDASTVLSGG